MKRWFLLILTLVLVVSTLSGCSEKSKLDPKDPVILSMWHVYGENADAPMNRLVEEFNSTVGLEKGIVVTVTNVTSSSKINAQLKTALAGDPGAPAVPDIFSAHTNTASSKEKGSLVDWNKYFSKDELAKYVPGFIADGTINDELLVFPVSKSSYALFVNGSQFERFSADTGVSYESLSTWEGFFDAAAKYYDWSDGKCFCAFDYLIRHMEFDIMATTGGIEYTEDGWYHLEDPAVKTSWMKFAVPFAQGHIAVADTYSNTQVMTGEALTGIGSTASITYYNDTVTYPDNSSEPMNLVVLPLPKSGDGTQYMPITGVGMSAFKTTEKKAEAAAEFLRWFTESQRNLDFVVETGYMPVRSDAFSAIDSYAFPDSGYASLYNTIQVMLENYEPVVRPDFSGFYKRVETLYNGLRQMRPDMIERFNSGESVDVLAEEVWNFLCSVE